MVLELYDILKVVAPTVYLKRPSTFPSITYTIIDQAGEVYAEGEVIEEGVVVHIDIWTKEEMDFTLNGQVKEAMEVQGFRLYSQPDFYDNELDVYQKVLKFNYLRGVE